MNSLNEIVVDASHPMASSNTGNTLVFRNTVGNYMSRKAYIEMLASTGSVSHRFLSPKESQWVFQNRKGI